MSESIPYHISHIDLREFLKGICDFSVLEEKEYLVFWWKNIPLGHLYINALKYQKAEKWRQLIWTGIERTLSYYTEKHHLDFDKLRRDFFANDTAVFEEKIERIFISYQKAPQQKLPSVSVVICTRNRTSLLAKCLEALEQLNYQASEVIVVDNTPDDDSTKEMVETYSRVRYLKEDRKGLDFARNCGLRAAKGDIVAFTDDDVDLHPDWVWRLAQNFLDPRIQAITGLVLAKSLESPAQYHFEKYWSFNRGYLPVYYDAAFVRDKKGKGIPVWEIGAGANMAFRRSIFEAVGAFDIRLDMGAAGCNGDSEMWYRILAEGWTIKYDPLVIAYHTHRLANKAFEKQIYQYMRGFSSAVLIEYSRYRNNGELYHLFRRLPAYYFRRLMRRLALRREENNLTLWQEIAGYLAGLRYYLGNRKKAPFERSFYRPFPVTHIGENPLVSIVITTYNHARYLPESLGSVFAQTHGNIECLVVDDGSTDNTRELVSLYAKVKYIYQGNQGLAAARNTGALACQGDFVIFLDADDWLYPDAAAIQLRQFRREPALAFISGSHDKVNDRKVILPFEESKLPEEEPYQALLQANFIGMHAAVMYRREVFDYFLFDTQLKACEDYDFYLRVSRIFKTGSHSRKLAAYRLHGNNMSANKHFMLHWVKKVLKKQLAFLPDKQLYAYYQKGLKNWKAYYKTEVEKQKRIQ